MVIYSGCVDNVPYRIQYVEGNNEIEKNPPFTLVLTKSSASDEVLSKLEKVTKNNPFEDQEVEFIFGKIQFEKIYKVVILD